MSNGKGNYSVLVTLKKGAIHTVLAFLPAVAGLAAIMLQSSNAGGTLERAWPAAPVAVIIGAVVGLLNWLKNRGK